jgi:Uma2 family endonuclease
VTHTLSKPDTLGDPSLRRWTKAEYYGMADLGWFKGQRVELIEGEIVVLSPQKFAHGQVADRVTELLRHAFGPDFWVRMQLPLDLGESSEPEPDVSVVRGRRESFSEHPRTAELIVEISDTTLAYDRREKASLYASSGIADYWVVNLVQRQVHVFRDPQIDGGQSHGFGYRSMLTFLPGEQITPLAMGKPIAVNAILG